jgi:hypothetical protein
MSGFKPAFDVALGSVFSIALLVYGQVYYGQKFSDQERGLGMGQ